MEYLHYISLLASACFLPMHRTLRATYKLMSEVDHLHDLLPPPLAAAAAASTGVVAAVLGWAVGITLGDRGSVTTVQSAREVRTRASGQSKTSLESSPPSRAKAAAASGGDKEQDSGTDFSKAQYVMRMPAQHVRFGALPYLH